MCDLTVLKSVFTREDIFWNNIANEGKKLIIESELENFIEEDFHTDRYHLSNFLDLHCLWDSFDVALGNTELLYKGSEKLKLSCSSIDWLTQLPSFNLDVFYYLLSNLNVLSSYKKYMFNQLEDYHQECCDCGYPLKINDKTKLTLLQHISWNN